MSRSKVNRDFQLFPGPLARDSPFTNLAIKTGQPLIFDEVIKDKSKQLLVDIPCNNQMTFLIPKSKLGQK